jgi:hypothetical protein
MLALYEAILPTLRATARSHGYALGLHGSGQRDLDLIAAPWTEDASAAEVLVEALRASINGHISEHEGYNPMSKPHGRRVWSIRPLEGNPRAELYVDLSVMPLLPCMVPGNPKPQTYEAAMLAYEGACAALRNALSQLADYKSARRLP